MANTSISLKKFKADYSRFLHNDKVLRLTFQTPAQRNDHSRSQRPRSFWSAPRITTSAQVQRHSGFEWICKHNRLRPEPIKFVRLDSEHAQSDGKSVNRGLRTSVVGHGQRSRFLVLTKRSAASGDENA